MMFHDLSRLLFVSLALSL